MSQGDFSFDSLESRNERLSDQLAIVREELKVCQNNYSQQEKEYNRLLDYVTKHEEQFSSVEVEHEESIEEIPPICSRTKNEKTKKNLASQQNELEKAREELKLVEVRETKIKHELKLKADVSHEVVVDKIRTLVREKKRSDANFKKISNAFADVQQEKKCLQIRIRELEGEITTLELQINQQEQNERRLKNSEELKRLFQKLPQIGEVKELTDTHPKQAHKGLNKRVNLQAKSKNTARLETTTEPKTRMAGRNFSGLKPPGETSRPPVPKLQPAMATQRCVFCGKPFPIESPTGPRFDTHCHTHHHVFKDAKWNCCKGGYESGGCLRVPHMRVEIIGRNQLLLTDGTQLRSMWLSW